MALYAAVVAADLHGQNAYWFVHVGRQSLTAASTSKRIVPSLEDVFVACVQRAGGAVAG